MFNIEGLRSSLGKLETQRTGYSTRLVDRTRLAIMNHEDSGDHPVKIWQWIE
ncbi:hypothetical protein PGTUg99_035186 [Puccinia graminis f. sp. tritici]|uniref:Uncharacterized protein n=1 Tax=Puccinia graminis f. sp. tritici TaxID=56615 RepID=A0A5B0RJ50_PUCGR|nr:hypothetical protein PGTUg99_035186 [Puccinia graminis f. sp. tritici]